MAYFSFDRKSTRLNSSHLVISYAVFCLKKKDAICARRSTPVHPRIPSFSGVAPRPAGQNSVPRSPTVHLGIPSFSESAVLFCNDTATTEIYTLSLHDALPISNSAVNCETAEVAAIAPVPGTAAVEDPDRKSTRLNSSHLVISYAVFCLKK